MMQMTEDYIVWIVSEPWLEADYWLTEQAYQDVQEALENVN